MPATKTPQHAKKKQNTAELVRSGAKMWEFKNGKFYDPKRHAYILRCHGCNKPFYAKRLDAKTHSPACRKRVQRRTLKQNRKLLAEMRTADEAQLFLLGF